MIKKRKPFSHFAFVHKHDTEIRFSFFVAELEKYCKKNIELQYILQPSTREIRKINEDTFQLKIHFLRGDF
jgi:hypothetical protein